jgi:hypothetical protein
VHRDDIGRKVRGKRKRLISQAIPFLGHDKDEWWLARSELKLIVIAQGGIDVRVIAVDCLKLHNNAGDGDDRDPAAFREFGYYDNR